MIVETLIGYLQKCPSGAEVWMSTKKDLGEDSKSKEIISVMIDFPDDVVLIIKTPK